jgi:uncharacterized protein YndB with AHSA1/START domain
LWGFSLSSGAGRTRTGYPLLAKQVLYQLSYSPKPCLRHQTKRTPILKILRTRPRLKVWRTGFRVLADNPSVTRASAIRPRRLLAPSAPAKCSDVSSTRITRRLNAPRPTVYHALLDARAVATWMVPNGMSSHVHTFEAREGGSFRISLTYDDATGMGKTTAHTDTYYGRFVKLVTNEQVVEVVEFETTDPALRGEMTITITLADADGGTDLVAVHEGLPPGLSAADNAAGWRLSLEKLAALVEAL